MSTNEQPATGVRKRQQIASTNKQMIIYVAGAAAIVTICIMLAINFWQRIAYQMKVNGEWGTTNDTLRNSIANIPVLRNNIEALSANNNIKSIQELVDPGLDKWQVIFDVLPSSCDPLAVEYAFTNIIFKPSGMGAGVKDATAAMEEAGCDMLEVSDVPSGNSGSVNPQALAMKVRFSLVNARDEDIRKALLSMEYSLHPINVVSIDITSDENGTRKAEVTATTYFVPKANWHAGTKKIPVDENAPKEGATQ